MKNRHYTWAKSPEDYLEQRITRTSECWLWDRGKDKDGYGQCHDSKWAKLLGVTRAHQLAYRAWVGPIPEGMFVCHTCDNPPCVNPDHLWLGTAKTNNADMMQKGRYVSPHAVHDLRKVKPEDVLQYKGVMSAVDVASLLGISWGRVYQIWRGDKCLNLQGS